MARGIVIALALGLWAGGCGLHEDIEYTPADEMKPGPGLFSGKSGEWRLLGDEADEAPAAGEAQEGEPDRPLKVRRRR